MSKRVQQVKDFSEDGTVLNENIKSMRIREDLQSEIEKLKCIDIRHDIKGN